MFDLALRACIISTAQTACNSFACACGHSRAGQIRVDVNHMGQPEEEIEISNARIRADTVHACFFAGRCSSCGAAARHHATYVGCGAVFRLRRSVLFLGPDEPVMPEAEATTVGNHVLDRMEPIRLNMPMAYRDVSKMPAAHWRLTLNFALNTDRCVG